MFLDLVKQARSHRGFRQDRKVTRQELEHLVECARFTPAARNDQVLKYYLAEETGDGGGHSASDQVGRGIG